MLSPTLGTLSLALFATRASKARVQSTLAQQPIHASAAQHWNKATPPADAYGELRHTTAQASSILRGELSCASAGQALPIPPCLGARCAPARASEALVQGELEERLVQAGALQALLVPP